MTGGKRRGQCRAVGCPSDVDQNIPAPFCRPHWRLVPKEQRDDIKRLAGEGYPSELSLARAIRKAIETLEILPVMACR